MDENHLNMFLKDFKDMFPNIKFLLTSKVRIQSFLDAEFIGKELRVEPLEIQFTEKLF